MALQDLDDNGVSVVLYFTDEQISIDGAVDKFLVAARNFASEFEREKISQRTYEHLVRKAKAGRPAGGISYGYRIEAGAYVVDEPQAAVVRRIFELYANGTGQRSIARLLNDEGIPAPRAGKRGTGSWAPTAIREMLRNTRYVGVGRYNQTRKLHRGGTKVREARAATELVTYACRAIVNQELFDAVSARTESNQRFGEVKATRGARARNLLTGYVRCAVCGGPITVANRRHGRENRKVYVCGWRRDRGSAICANSAAAFVVDVDQAVIEGVRKFLTPDIVAEVLRELRSVLAARFAESPQEQLKLTTEAEKLRRAITRLTNALALAASDDPPSAVIQMIGQKEKRLRQVEAQLATHGAALSTVERELDAMEREARARLLKLDREFRDSPERAREVLAKLTRVEKLKFQRSADRMLIEGPIAVPEVLLSGTTTDPDCGASPAGFEPFQATRLLPGMSQACEG